MYREEVSRQCPPCHRPQPLLLRGTHEQTACRIYLRVEGSGPVSGCHTIGLATCTGGFQQGEEAWPFPAEEIPVVRLRHRRAI